MVAPEAGPIVLLTHIGEGGVVEDSDESLETSHAFDLNVPIVVEHDWFPDPLPVTGGDGDILGVGFLSQDSDPFDLLPIIEAVTK